jgi:hypothetical protein
VRLENQRAIPVELCGFASLSLILERRFSDRVSRGEAIDRTDFIRQKAGRGELELRYRFSATADPVMMRR